jgi:hypothetical protein
MSFFFLLLFLVYMNMKWDGRICQKIFLFTISNPKDLSETMKDPRVYIVVQTKVNLTGGPYLNWTSVYQVNITNNICIKLFWRKCNFDAYFWIFFLVYYFKILETQQA